MHLHAAVAGLAAFTLVGRLRPCFSVRHQFQRAHRQSVYQQKILHRPGAFHAQFVIVFRAAFSVGMSGDDQAVLLFLLQAFCQPGKAAAVFGVEFCIVKVKLYDQFVMDAGQWIVAAGAAFVGELTRRFLNSICSYNVNSNPINVKVFFFCNILANGKNMSICLTHHTKKTMSAPLVLSHLSKEVFPIHRERQCKFKYRTGF